MKNNHIPELGNVYPAKGGHGRGAPDYWVVIAIIGSQNADLLGKKAVLLGVKRDMTIVSAANYSLTALSEREILFKLDITELRFET